MGQSSAPALLVGVRAIAASAALPRSTCWRLLRLLRVAPVGGRYRLPAAALPLLIAAAARELGTRLPAQAVDLSPETAARRLLRLSRRVRAAGAGGVVSHDAGTGLGPTPGIKKEGKDE